MTQPRNQARKEEEEGQREERETGGGMEEGETGQGLHIHLKREVEWRKRAG